MEESSIDRQQRMARELWEQRERDYLALIDPDELTRMEEGTLLRQCREALDMERAEVIDGVLKGIISHRRLQRVEQGVEDVPPKAWHAYAQLLHYLDRDDLVAKIAEVYPEVG